MSIIRKYYKHTCKSRRTTWSSRPRQSRITNLSCKTREQKTNEYFLNYWPGFTAILVLGKKTGRKIKPCPIIANVKQPQTNLRHVFEISCVIDNEWKH